MRLASVTEANAKKWVNEGEPEKYNPEQPRKEYIGVEEAKQLWDVGVFGALERLFVEKSTMPRETSTIHRPHPVQGSVLCNDRGETSGFARFLFFLFISFMAFINASPDLCTNFCCTVLQSIGLGIAISCDRSQTGLIPKEYDVFTLLHLSKLSTFCLAALVGQMSGSCGGAYFLADMFITFNIPVAGSSGLYYDLVSPSR